MNPLIISGLFGAAQSLIERFFPDPEKKAAAQLELLRMQQSGELATLAASTDLARAQAAINQAEASSGNAYVAGWRPAIGYVFAAAIAWTYVLKPVALWAVAIWKPGLALPDIQLDDHLWELMSGMLGLAGLRTLDKKNGKD